MKNLYLNLSKLFAILILVSCGNEKKTSHQASNEEELKILSGLYMAKLNPVNLSQTPRLRGSLTVVESEDMTATIRIAGGPPSSLSFQGIHTGRCPGKEDDLNKDGFIDGEEGQMAFQDVLIPLDDDLNSQRMGWGIFPITDKFGEYIWSRVGQIEKILSDLNEEDINPSDNLVKLRNSPLSFENKIIVIRGISTSVILPDTISGSGRFSPHASFPVACGRLKKVIATPGEIEKDGETTINHDSSRVGHGVDDDATFPETDGSDINYGN